MISFTALCAVLLLVADSLAAAPLNPNNILVSIGPFFIREFTPTGTLVQEFTFNYANREVYPGGEFLRDIVVDPYGFIDGYNGTFFPFLTRYSPVDGTFTHKPFPNWSTVNYSDFGGIAAWQNYIFATDTFTVTGGASGIIRFDTITNKAARYLDGYDFTDVTVGLDGKLYAFASPQTIFVLDPATMDLIATITLPDEYAFDSSIDVRGIAVDQFNHLFLAGFNGTIYRLNILTGNVEATFVSGRTHLGDIEVDETGRLIVMQDQGWLYVGDTSLSHFTSFYASQGIGATSFFTCFARPVPAPIQPLPTPTPTPSPTATPVPKHDIFVSLGTSLWSVKTDFNTVSEFTPDGVLLHSTSFNYNGAAGYPTTEYLRDIVVDDQGVISAYNGTFDPYLTSYSPATGIFAHTTSVAWNTWNYDSFGGIARFGTSIFLTDMDLFGESQLNGIVRYDTVTNTFARYAQGTNFMDLNVGLDGLLYGLVADGGSGTDVNVYNPKTMEFVRSIPLPVEVAGYDHIHSIAVDQNSRMFLCGLNGVVYRLDSNGTVEVEAAPGWNNLSDIDIDETGRIIVASQNCQLIVTDTTLEDFKSYPIIDPHQANYATVYVAFGPLGATPTPTPTPTPTSTPTPTPTPTPSATPIITLSVAPVQIGEGGTAALTISASSGTTRPVTISYSTSGNAALGNDYTLNPTGQVTIPIGQNSVTLTLTALTDAIKEKKETVTVTLNTGPGYSFGEAIGKKKKKPKPPSATLTITNSR
ncbi:MAG: putative secreted protein [Spartobacteria bacterium]|nr:putative secreted protein [Spartobacteria bacterium]